MLRIHHAPKGEIAPYLFYHVTLNGEKTDPWFCRVSSMPHNTVWPGFQRPAHQTEVASFLSFEMDETVTLEVSMWREMNEVVVRPLSRGVRAEVSEDRHTARVTIPACGHYTLEINGPHQAMHIFANPVNDFGVDKSDPSVLYYAPGVHDVGTLELQDGQTLFVDGGAVLYGSVQVLHKKNVRIVGYGVIDGSKEVRTSDTLLITWGLSEPNQDFRDETKLREHIKKFRVLEGCVHLYSCQDCEINGVITRDSSTFAFVLANCERVSVEWAKTIGMWRYNSDGIDTFNSRYLRIANCFLRDFDDCMVIKGIKGWDKADQHHITVTGCTIWCDWGSSLELGAETCADEYHDIIWEDCDIIHASHVCMRFHNSDRAWVHDMTVRNIRCEYSKYDMEPVYQHDMTTTYPSFDKLYQPTLIHSPIYDGPYSNDHILGRVSGVKFENIQIYADEGLPVPTIVFEGADEVHCNKDVTIENVTFNGRRLTPEEVPTRTSEWDEVTVK